MINGGTTAQIVGCAASLGIFDALYKKQLTEEALLSQVEANTDGAYRLIHALIALRLIKKENATLSLEDRGTYFAQKHPDTIAPLAIYKAHPLFWKPLGYLKDGIEKGASPFECAFGMDLFSYLDTDHAAARIFHRAMDCFTKQSSTALLRTYPFHSIETILDVGGGTGAFGEVLLSQFPNLSYTTFDLKSALAFVSSPVVKKMEGSFFDAIPPGYDVYILRNILHDWSDEKGLEILQNCQLALKGTSRLLIMETLLTKGALGRLADITMAALTPGGKERTLEDFEMLCMKAGLTIKEVYKTTSAKAILEVVPSVRA